MSNVSHKNQSDTNLYLIASCFVLPLSAVIIFINTIIIIGIAFNKKLHTTTNYFFLSLLFADFFTGVALPFIPRMLMTQGFQYGKCLFIFICPNFFFLSFLANLVMVHYERYLYIVHPLHYACSWVQRYVYGVLLVVWVLPLIYACLPAFGWNGWANDNNSCSTKFLPSAYIYLENYVFLLPGIFATAVMTYRVLSIARKQLHDIQKLHRAVNRGGISEAEQKMTLRHAKCTAAVTVVFLLCWVPYIAYIQVIPLTLRLYVNESTHVILSCVGSGSAAIMPLIVGLSNKQYTELWRNLFRNRCKCWVR
ncbi:G-protein coupled bile acid receptor 1 [Protopterus annectens]|uniref:G-protein coupled bile acid receptor 1 n=1 Tax=Protopterus annectens TaxID=7888 RepID=UPI001CFAD903|nr:G-protein coupled bile acid receptor 1 [Protopterus annectens]